MHANITHRALCAVLRTALPCMFTPELDNNPGFFANLPMPTVQYAEPPVRNVPRPVAVAARDPVMDYASVTIGDFWRDGVREASYSGIDRQFADAFDGLLANPVGVSPRVVPGQQMSDALYLAGPVPIARYDLGIASLTVNGALNFVNGVANAGLNALGALTEPLDRYQGEITSVETGLGPLGIAAVAPTLLLGRLSSAIRASTVRHAAWSSDLTEISGSIERLGQRALRQSGGDARYAERLFEDYLQGVTNRLSRTGSEFGIDIQPAALAGGDRVPGFIFLHRGGPDTSLITAADGSPRLFAWISAVGCGCD